jgi:hypothetical protein
LTRQPGDKFAVEIGDQRARTDQRRSKLTH